MIIDQGTDLSFKIKLIHTDNTELQPTDVTDLSVRVFTTDEESSITVSANSDGIVTVLSSDLRALRSGVIAYSCSYTYNGKVYDNADQYTNYYLRDPEETNSPDDGSGGGGASGQYYTKEESDSRFANKQDIYSKTETNSLLAQKANKNGSETEPFTAYTLNLRREGANTALYNYKLNGDEYVSFYDQTGGQLTYKFTPSQADEIATERQLATKANASDVYTKTQVDDIISAGEIGNNLPKYDGTNKIKILGIGNSYMTEGTRELCGLLTYEGLTQSDIQLEIAYYPARTLETWEEYIRNGGTYEQQVQFYYDTTGHYWNRTHQDATNIDIRDTIRNTDWDIIVLQEFPSSGTPSASNYDSYSQTLKRAIAEIKALCPNENVCFGWQMIWSNNQYTADNDQVWKNICDAVKQTLKNTDVRVVIPVGTAYQNAYNTNPFRGWEHHFLLQDSIGHPAAGAARFISSAAWFESLIAPLYGRSLLDNDYLPTFISDGSISYPDSEVPITAGNIDLAKWCAIAACQNMYQVNYEIESAISNTGGSGGEANVIEAVSFNGTVAPIENKTAKITATIPTALSQLSGDSTHRTVTDTEKTTWNNKQGAIRDLDTIRSGAALGATAVQDSSYVHTDNNYTTTEKDKLSGIAEGAEVNVQSDWNVTNSSSDAFIKNKPTIPAAQIQSDWNQTTTTAKDYIKNKPTIPTVVNSITSGSTNAVQGGAIYTALQGKPSLVHYNNPTDMDADLSQLLGTIGFEYDYEGFYIFDQLSNEWRPLDYRVRDFSSKQEMEDTSVSNGTIGWDSSDELFYIYDQSNDSWLPLTETSEVITISTAGAVSRSLDPNKFYKFTGTLSSLTITALNSGSGICVYAGKFTAGNNFSGLSFPASVTPADNVPTIEAGETYEFSVLDNLLLIVKEG